MKTANIIKEQTRGYISLMIENEIESQSKRGLCFLNLYEFHYDGDSVTYYKKFSYDQEHLSDLIRKGYLIKEKVIKSGWFWNRKIEVFHTICWN